MELFESTISRGSILGILLLSYSMNVAIETLRTQFQDPRQVFSAKLPHSLLATLYAYASLPVVAWPAIYIALHDGVIAAALAWFLLQVLGGLATVKFGISGSLLSLHILATFVALPLGYYLTLSTTPWP